MFTVRASKRSNGPRGPETWQVLMPTPIPPGSCWVGKQNCPSKKASPTRCAGAKFAGISCISAPLRGGCGFRRGFFVIMKKVNVIPRLIAALLLLAAPLVHASTVLAQSEGLLVIGKPDTSAFPTMQFEMAAHDAQ